MSTLITIIHVFVCFILIIAVLLQSGKSADLAGAFGGGGSQSVFGPRGAASLLSKATTTCAILFMFTSLGLWIISAKGDKSVLRGEDAPAQEATAATETTKPEETAAEEVKKKEQQPQEKEKKKEEENK